MERNTATWAGNTIVDLTPADIGRDVASLRAVAEATGLNVICGSGHYLSLAHPAGPGHLQRFAPSPTSLVAELQERHRRHQDPFRGDRRGRHLEPHPSRRGEGAEGRRPATGKRPCLSWSISRRRHGEARGRGRGLDILAAEGADLGHVLLSHIDNMLVPGHRGWSHASRGAVPAAGAGLPSGLRRVRQGASISRRGTTPYPSFWCPSDQIRAPEPSLQLGIPDRLIALPRRLLQGGADLRRVRLQLPAADRPQHPRRLWHYRGPTASLVGGQPGPLVQYPWPGLTDPCPSRSG